MATIFESPRDLIGAEGTRLGPTGWLAITQDRVDGFAEVTEDRQWIHVDVERAKDGPFGGTIAHGYLTMSLVNFFLPQLIEVRGFSHAVNIGADGLRFLSPVKVGSSIRGVGEIVSVAPDALPATSPPTISVVIRRIDSSSRAWWIRPA